MSLLSKLRPQKGSKKSMKRVGRGDGSGHGGTSGLGHKGQLARTSSDVSRGFEGGQMPLQRRSPKWGFTNVCGKNGFGVNLDTLSKSFKAGETVDPKALQEKHLIPRGTEFVKILGRGKLDHALKISVHGASASAKKAIEASKGTLTIIESKPKKKAA